MLKNRIGNDRKWICGIFALMVLGAVSAAIAEGNVFWWKGPEWGRFDDPDNWDVGETGGGNPYRLVPGAEDAFAHASSAKIDLSGGSFTVKRRAKDLTSAETGKGISHVLHITNGTLKVTDHHSAKLNLEVWDGATYSFSGATYTDSHNISAEAEQEIHQGGRIEVVDSVGLVRLYGLAMTVEEGGCLYLNPEKFQSWPNAAKELTFTNYGTIDAPGGIYFASPGWGSNADKSTYFPRFLQNGGVLKIGGKVGRYNSHRVKQLGLTLSGGTVEITNSVYFANMSANPPAVADNADIVFDVKADSVFDIADLAMGENVTITKTGPGELKTAGDLPSTLVVSAGRIAFAEAVATAAISFGTNTQIRIDAESVRIDECANFTNAEFSVAESLLQVGTTVLLSKDGDILAHAKKGLDAQLLAAGVSAEGRIESDALFVRSAYPYTFNADKSSDLMNPGAWSCAEVPPVTVPVRIRGAGVANYNAESPKFASITVEEGATLCVVGGTEESPVDMPPIELDYDVRLLLAEGSVVQITNAFTCVGNAETLPVFEVSTNATAIVQTPAPLYIRSSIFKYDGDGYDYGFRIKNVALRWYGAIKTYYGDTGAQTVYSRLLLGWAEENETSYIAVDCRGGRYIAAGEGNHGVRSRTALAMVVPQPGGTVVPVGTLYFRDYSCEQRMSSSPAPEYYTPGFVIGRWNEWDGGNPVDGNPTSVKFDVLFEGATDMNVNGVVRVGGGAHVILRGPEVQWRYVPVAWSDEYLSRTLILTDDGSLELEDGAYIGVCSTDQPERGFVADGTGSGQTTFTVSDSRMSVLNWYGSGNSIAKIRDSVLDIGYLRTANTLGDITGVFDGFRAVEISNVFTIAAADIDRGNGKKDSVRAIENWNRRVLVGVPLTGTGSLVVSNRLSGAHAVYSMTVTVTNGANTATGKVFAAKTAGGAPTALVFADGANWAGEVVSDGNVSLTNLLSEGAAAEVSFGALRADSAFPIRVWKTDGEIASNDKVNLASALSGAGSFSLIEMDEPLAFGDKFEIGLYPADAALPQDTRRLRFSAAPSDTEGCVRLTATYGNRGFVVILL